MEYKVRQESHSLLEKMFATHAVHGVISSSNVPNLLKQFNSEIELSPGEFESQVGGITGEVGDEVGGLDFDSFEKVMIHYLVKQSRKESNEFGHKNVIRLADFDTP